MMTRAQARFIVDSYYQIQEARKSAGNQTRAAGEDEEPHALVDFVFNQMRTCERNLHNMLDEYSSGQKAGRWAKSLIGIGPVITAGLLAHIDIHKAPYVGNIWRFAGLDPNVEWLGKVKATKLMAEMVPPRTRPTSEHIAEIGLRLNRRPELIANLARKDDGTIDRASLTKALARRPWNAKLKTLCWKIGVSFTKSSGHEQTVYGPVYASRKAQEEYRNQRINPDTGRLWFQDQAEHSLATKKIGRSTEAYKWYSKGMLPPARILIRSQRYAVKLFLSHFHHVLYEVTFGKAPPMPYILTKSDHGRFIGPPNWPMANDE